MSRHTERPAAHARRMIFENAARKIMGVERTHDFGMFADGCYALPASQRAWSAWQAATSAIGMIEDDETEAFIAETLAGPPADHPVWDEFAADLVAAKSDWAAHMRHHESQTCKLCESDAAPSQAGSCQASGEAVPDKPLTPFLEKTNRECREWMTKTFVPEAIDGYYLPCLWAWQEQERRYAPPAGRTLTEDWLSTVDGLRGLAPWLRVMALDESLGNDAIRAMQGWADAAESLIRAAFAASSTTAATQSHHVCGQQGFGAIGDTCGACRAQALQTR